MYANIATFPPPIQIFPTKELLSPLYRIFYFRREFLPYIDININFVVSYRQMRVFFNTKV